MRDFDELRDLREPRTDRHVRSTEVARPTATVPLFVRSADRFLHGDRESEAFREIAGECGVLRDHPVEITVTRQGEVEPDAEAVQRWVAAPDEAERSSRGAQAAELVVVLARLQLDVVTEPFRLLVRVGMTTDVDEQRGVVDDRAIGFVEPEAFAEA